MIRKLRALLLFYKQLAGFSNFITLALAWVALTDPESWAFVSFVKLLLSILALALFKHFYSIRFFFLYNLGFHTWEILFSLLAMDYIIFMVLIQLVSNLF